MTPVHFYQPIPNTQSLPETVWSRPNELIGIDMNDAVQLDLLIFRAVRVRAGENTIQFYYPQYLYFGLVFLSWTTLITVFAMPLWKSREEAPAS